MLSDDEKAAKLAKIAKFNGFQTKIMKLRAAKVYVIGSARAYRWERLHAECGVQVPSRADPKEEGP